MKTYVFLSTVVGVIFGLTAVAGADTTLEDVREKGYVQCGVSHEMGFARKVANRVIFMDEGQIIEQNEPEAFFSTPKSDRTKLFLSQILGH